jgi:hypothetical protein
MSPVAFQILSDLHLETHASYNYPLKQTAPNLALLGDIGHVADSALFSFLERQLGQYWNVFFLMGNHEPVHISWPVARQKMRDFAERMERLRTKSTMGRFVFLDQTRHDISETVTILGCTLFSQVTTDQAADVGSRFIDFSKIHDWHVDDHIKAHQADLQWLNSQVSAISSQEPHRQIAIFTHYCPTVDERAQDERHRGSAVSSGFLTDLSMQECWKNTSVITWAFGHTHFNCEFVDDLGKHVITNQKGYASAPKETFRMKKVFLIGQDVGESRSTGLV